MVPVDDGSEGQVRILRLALTLTEPKLKYEKYPWLAFTQLVEIFSADTPLERAREIADLQTVLIQWTNAMGFNPLDIYARRAEDKSPDFANIVRKYDEKYKEIIERTN